MDRIVTAIFLCLLASATSVYAQQPSQAPLTNDAVVKLVKAGFKDKTVIAIINNRPASFKLDTEQLIDLKRNGVKENIILAMLSSQMGTVFLDEDEWTSESLFKDSKKPNTGDRSEEHTSELQSQSNLVCRLLLEKKKKKNQK